MLEFRVFLCVKFLTSGQQRLFSRCPVTSLILFGVFLMSLTFNLGLILAVFMLLASHQLYSLQMPSLHHQHRNLPL